MVRAYTGEPVDPAALRRILHRARRAPSAGYSQGQRFAVVTDPELRGRLADAAGEPGYVARGFDPWLSRAPVHIVLCASAEAYRQRYAEPDKATSTPPDDWDVPFWWVDAGAALMLLLLAAVDERLAAGFTSIRAGSARAILDLPDEWLPVGLVTLGHPARDRRSGSLARGALPFAEVVRPFGADLPE